MRKKLPVEQMIAEDAASYAHSLSLYLEREITVDDLKNTQVSLYDIITARYDDDAVKAFSSSGSVFRAANFFTVKALLKK